MRHLKKFETFYYSNESELIEEIRDTVDSLVYDHETYDEFDPNEYPEIKTDLALLSQKNKDIEDVYDVVEPEGMSLDEFTILFKKMAKESEENVINYLIQHPFKNIENITGILDIPQWVIDNNKILGKYNI